MIGYIKRISIGAPVQYGFGKDTVVKGWVAYDHNGYETDEAFIGYNTFLMGPRFPGISGTRI